MYTPPAFREDSLDAIHAWICVARLASLVTAGPGGLMATPLPLFLEPAEGERGVLYGHVAKANPQWRDAPGTEALVIFMGPDAYVSPSWYAGKLVDGKVVPTWNYVAVHAYGLVEFFEDADRLLSVVTTLTHLHESPRAAPWAVSDAPAPFVASQLRGIVGVRIPITRLEGKRKMSQNRRPCGPGRRRQWSGRKRRGGRPGCGSPDFGLKLRRGRPIQLLARPRPDFADDLPTL